MELGAFAANLYRAKQVNKDSSKEIKSLLPQQQKRRSYQDIERKTSPVLPLTLRKHFYGEDKNEWTMQYYVQFPFGSEGQNLFRGATNEQIKEFAEDYLSNRLYGEKEKKYVEIIRADKTKVVVKFLIEDWFEDSFGRTPKFRYSPPTSLIYSYRISPPNYFMLGSTESDFNLFVEKRFEEWLKKKPIERYARKHFEWLKKVTSDLFAYSLDTHRGYIKASLKYSVVLGSLALYIAWKHGKEMGKSEVRRVQSRVSRLGDVKKLDRYIKRL
jgi:hypothetical protein